MSLGMDSVAGGGETQAGGGTGSGGAGFVIPVGGLSVANCVHVNTLGERR